jgi:CheY-like chemotaxis protein
MQEAKNILIVEDEHALSHALESEFTGRGFNVCLAANGEEGLACAKRQPPDIILLDMMMPVMDGVTMLEHMRQESWGKHIPVIALSNINEPEKVTRCMESGVFDYLVKADWKMEDIVDKVCDRLNH